MSDELKDKCIAELEKKIRDIERQFNEYIDEVGNSDKRYRDRIAELEAEDELLAELAAVYTWLDEHSVSGDGDYACAILWKEDWQIAWDNIEATLNKYDPDYRVNPADWSGQKYTLTNAD